MKKVVTLLLISCMCLCVLAGCGEAESSYHSKQDKTEFIDEKEEAVGQTVVDSAEHFIESKNDYKGEKISENKVESDTPFTKRK